MKNIITWIICASALTTLHAGAAEKVKPYTSDICIVTDNKLGSMGRVITKTHKDQQVKFCCKPCVKKFDRNPEKYLSKLKKGK